jgi:hypothetical protein
MAGDHIYIGAPWNENPLLRDHTSGQSRAPPKFNFRSTRKIPSPIGNGLPIAVIFWGMGIRAIAVTAVQSVRLPNALDRLACEAWNQPDARFFKGWGRPGIQLMRPMAAGRFPERRLRVRKSTQKVSVPHVVLPFELAWA